MSNPNREHAGQILGSGYPDQQQPQNKALGGLANNDANQQTNLRQPYDPYPGPQMSMSETAFCEIIPLIGPAFVYNLYVHPSDVIDARQILRTIKAQYIENPLSPWINLQTDHSLDRREWYLGNPYNGKCVGCKGY